MKDLKIIHESFPDVMPPEWAKVANALKLIDKDSHDSGGPKLPLASIGTQVLIQNPHSKLWNRSGTVKGVFRNGRTYLVELANGKEYYRNGKFVRAM